MTFYILFTVKVSSDLVPIIYHEFTLCIQSKTKQEDADILLDIPVKDLTLNQLHGLKVNNQSFRKKNHLKRDKLNKKQVLFPNKLVNFIFYVFLSCP